MEARLKLPDLAKGEMSKVATTFSLEELSQLMQMLEKHQVTEFEIDRGGEKLRLKRGPESAPLVHYAAPSSSMSNASESSRPAPALQVLDLRSAEAPVAKVSSHHEVKSPMVGTFYRRPAPDAKPYVDVGSIVKKGEVLCIVEAMKLMNEIESDLTGKVVEVCLTDGQMVEYGEVLFRIDPTAS